MTRLAILGGGRMGEALLAGALRAGIPPSDVRVVERDPGRGAALVQRYSVELRTAVQAVADADVVVVAVKPPDVPGVLTDVGAALHPDAVVVCVAAGVTVSDMRSVLPPGTSVVRAMPNTPALVSCGMTALAGGDLVVGDRMRQVRELFGAVGEVVEVPETAMDAVTAVSGSGPAYFFLMVEAIVDAAVGLGLSRDLSRLLAVQTLRGAGEMLQVTGEHPVLLREAVTSPGGTTAAALTALEERGVRAAVAQALRQAALRSAELGGGRQP